MSSNGSGGDAAVAAAAIVAAGLAARGAACSSSQFGFEQGSTGTAASADKTSTVTIDLTPQGCEPKPAKITAGAVDFNVANKDAGAVSEAELRTSDLAKILGEQENLTPGLSGGFSLTSSRARTRSTARARPSRTGTSPSPARPPARPGRATRSSLPRCSGYAGYVRAEHRRPGQPHPDVLPGDRRRATWTRPRCCTRRRASTTSGSSRWPRSGAAWTPDRRPVGEPGHGGVAVHRLPPDRAAALAGQHADRGAEAVHRAGRERAAAADAGAQRPVQPAGDGERRHRPDQRGRDVEDHRRGGALLQHRPAGLPGQRRRRRWRSSACCSPTCSARTSLLPQIQQRDAAVQSLLARYKATPGYDDTGYVEYSTVPRPSAGSCRRR